MAKQSKALGGTVTFESEKGNGTKFTLEFPRRDDLKQP